MTQRIWARPASEDDDTLLIQVDDDQIYRLDHSSLELVPTVEPVTTDWVELIRETCNSVAHRSGPEHPEQCGCFGG